MGGIKPLLGKTDLVTLVEILGFQCYLTDIGNPHCIIFVDSYDFDWKKVGKQVTDTRQHPRYELFFLSQTD